MTHASLFSGIGGFDLAAEWAGWQNIFHCEWNPFGQKVLAHHFPNSKSYNDITKTDFSIHAGQIDVLTGGFPCQPYSSAGKQLGKADERHLFPHMLRCIKEVKPKWVIGENVRGLVSWGGGWFSTRCAMTWKGKDMKSNRFLFQLQVSTHHTNDIEFGLLPTPTLQDYTNSTFPPSQKKRFHLVGYLMRKGISANSHLNPQYVEEMMGFPKNWTLLPFQNGKINQSKHTEMQ
jgi:site-specific DNA-cytosine methylase